MSILKIDTNQKQDLRKKQCEIMEIVKELLEPIAKDFNKRYKDSEVSQISSSLTINGVTVKVSLGFGLHDEDDDQ